MKLTFATLIAGAALAAAWPSWAHHSYAMFDNAKKVTLVGTVHEFQWTNPHCFIQIVIPSQQAASPAGTEEWAVEMGSPSHLVRAGWKPATLKPGDKVTVVISPLRDGSKGGIYVSAIGPDGKAIGGAQ